MIFAYLGNVRSLWLICEDKLKYVQIFSISSVVINIILNYFLIKYIGITGAAYATLITSIAITMIVPSIFKETRKYPLFILQALRMKDFNLAIIKSYILSILKPRTRG